MWELNYCLERRVFSLWQYIGFIVICSKFQGLPEPPTGSPCMGEFQLAIGPMHHANIQIIYLVYILISHSLNYS